MQNTNRTASIFIALGLIFGLSSLGYLLADAVVSVKSLERTVTVKGLSEKEVPADVVIWPLTFQFATNDLQEAYQAIETKSAAVKKFLTQHGIAESEISTSPPQVDDLLAQQWSDKSKITYRYNIYATVTVYSKNVAAVSNAIANVVELGKKGLAVSSGGYGGGTGQYIFTGLNKLKPEMIEQATKNARSVAERFAQDSDSKLGKIKSARQGQFSISDRDSTTPSIKQIRVVSTVEYYLVD